MARSLEQAGRNRSAALGTIAEALDGEEGFAFIAERPEQAGHALWRRFGK